MYYSVKNTTFQKVAFLIALSMLFTVEHIRMLRAFTSNYAMSVNFVSQLVCLSVHFVRRLQYPMSREARVKS